MKPLASHTRFRTLVILAIVFVVGTPMLIGYSQGYRLDDAMSVIYTGGIYLQTDLSRTRVYIDGELVQSRGYFLRNTYLQNLRSNRMYEVWVERDGYQSWVKKLFVQQKLVTEAHPMMLPMVFEWETVRPDLPLLESSSLVPLATTSTEVERNPEYVRLEALFEKQTEQFVIEVATTSTTTVRGKPVATTTTVLIPHFTGWMEAFASTSNLKDMRHVRERGGVVLWIDVSGDLFVSWGREQEDLPYYFCHATCTDMYVIDWDEPIERVEFYPTRNDVMIVGSSRGVYAVEVDGRSSRNIQPFIEGEGLDFQIFDDGTLVVFDGEVFRKTKW